MLADKASIKVLSKYLDYINIFLFDFIIELSKNTSMNKYIIKLIESKQLLYRLIYSLKLVELETLKTYIEIYLKIGFIQSFKFLISISILFYWKLDRNLYFCINYQSLNNLIIKNWYLLSLISKILDKLDQAKYFI